MSATPSRAKNLWSGRLADSVGRRARRVTDSAKASVIALAPASGDADIDRAIVSTRRALADPPDTNPTEREQLLLQIAGTSAAHTATGCARLKHSKLARLTERVAEEPQSGSGE